MEIRTVPIASVRLGKEEILAVTKVLKSGRLRAGALTQEFENRFARAAGARFAIAVNSGTAALHLAYLALVKAGDEVIVPDFTFVATASMVVAAGAKPVFADVDPDTFTLDPKAIPSRITARTRAIAPVHLYGQPAAITPIRAIARKHRLRIIWDAAQAHGARFEGHDVGSFRDVVCYSFYPTKNMTTGEGGMITTQDSQLDRELRLLRSQGDKSRYEHVRIGFNYRLTEVAAAIGLAQLERLPQAIRRRRENARYLTSRLAGVRGIILPRPPRRFFHSYNLFTLRLDLEALGMTRSDFQRRMLEHGIETSVHYPLPLHRQPVFKGHGEDADFPVSCRLAETVVSIPAHPELTSEDLERVVKTVRKVAMPARQESSSTS